MFIHDRIEQAAIGVITTQLSASNMVSWSVHNGLSNNFVSYPLVKVICDNFAPDYKEQKISNGHANLTIAIAGIKQNMTPDAFKSGSNDILEGFFNTNIESQMMANTTDIAIQGLYDNGCEVMTLNDGWVVSQRFELVVNRTSF